MLGISIISSESNLLNLFTKKSHASICSVILFCRLHCQVSYSRMSHLINILTILLQTWFHSVYLWIRCLWIFRLKSMTRSMKGVCSFGRSNQRNAPSQPKLECYCLVRYSQYLKTAKSESVYWSQWEWIKHLKDQNHDSFTKNTPLLTWPSVP